MNEDVICTYLDLDDLILVCGLSASEEQVVKYVMRGYAVADIADYYGGARQTYNKFYSRAVEKICAAAIAQSIKGLRQIAKENGG